MRANNGVAGTDLRRDRVHVFQVLEHFLLERHGYAQARERQLADQRKQVGELAGLQGKVDRVHGFAVECRVHHQRGEGVLDRVSRHAVDPRGRIDLANSIGVGKRAGGNLAGSRFFTLCGGGEGEDAARANPQDPADKALIAHAEADHVGHVAGAFEKVHHHHVVGERFGGAHNLDKLRLVGPDAFENAIQILSRLKIVVGDDQGRATGAQLV